MDGGEGARQVRIAVRQHDLPEEALDDCETPEWLLDSLEQHPDEYLPQTVRAPELPAQQIRDALVDYWTSPS